MKIRRLHVLVAILAIAIGLIPFRSQVRSLAAKVLPKKGKSVADRVAQFGPEVRQRLAGRFQELGVSYPPKKLILVGFKKERQMEVWVAGSDGQYLHLKTYPIRRASGQLGPKLVEGDNQVPEGIYRIDSLHPNSLYHLALHVDYPNQFDRAKAALDKRRSLGGEIMIHGGAASAGCLAMGDPTAEDLFILAAETGLENVTLILSPVDFRTQNLPTSLPPPWTSELYANIKAELLKLKSSNEGGAPY